ncbi:cupin domain-containing protein [Tenacibaculum sp. Mcav3-52]|uniref:cupin domain-containing protein n=1 Tax=Tenacibaculum sp. Mcav3-52 TaxID=2917762 RepID=UPI001EF2B741|nr:cupin domain-containing protein [Tenacibaculum sp. Mcav3-52]MCG7503335.1 cupin domain-containing protein [Tenacibaculum sp. Mcav3-52]
MISYDMDTTQTINILQEAEKLKNYFSPKIISEVNNEYVKLAKIKGEDIPWHNHENEDELFYIIDGSLLMEIENQPSFTMKKGDLFVVPKGVNHRVSSSEDCLIMLIETKSTKHTGDVITPITKSIDNQKY